VGRAHLTEATSRDRLSRQFRADARSATRTKPDARADRPSDQLEMARSDGHVVQYQALDGRITRTERDGDRTVGRESYRLPSRGPISFRVRDEHGSTLASLIIRRRPFATGTDQGREYQIDALVGKDHRFSLGEGTKK
jgi:hypothetical protein